jgi:hypothetical protein
MEVFQPIRKLFEPAGVGNAISDGENDATIAPTVSVGACKLIHTSKWLLALLRPKFETANTFTLLRKVEH